MSVPVEMEQAVELFLRETAQQIPGISKRLGDLVWPLLDGASSEAETALAFLVAMSYMRTALIEGYSIDESLVRWADDTAAKHAVNALVKARGVAGEVC